MGFQYIGVGIVTLDGFDIGNILKLSIHGNVEAKLERHPQGGVRQKMERLTGLEVRISCGEYVPELVNLSMWGVLNNGVISIGAGNQEVKNLVFNGVNSMDATKQMIVTLPKVKFEFSKGLPLIEDAISEFELIGEVIKDVSNTITPYGTIQFLNL